MALEVIQVGSAPNDGTGLQVRGASAWNTVAVGRRGPNNDFQYFSGKITGLRINTTAVYASNFDVTAPAVLYPENIAGTVLLLKGAQANPYVDSSGSAHTITPNNMTWSVEYPG